MSESLMQKFEAVFGAGGEIREYFAPGRVNLIGEHTDYNGGHVFPCALTIGTYGYVRKRNDHKLRFYSMNYEEAGIVESSLEDLIPSEAAGWTNYPKGVVWTFEKYGYRIPSGFDFLIWGNIPNGSGLSSSASLEVLTGLMLKDLYGIEEISMQDIALYGQYAENNFNGMKCGIMDQFASAMGKKNCAIYLNTNTMVYEYAPLKMENVNIVIINSKVKHNLVNSAYNDRRKECEFALKQLRTVYNAESLCEINEAVFEVCKKVITDEVCRKRAKHAIYENQRTTLGVMALAKGDINGFGKLMNESHISLRDDYEVSCEEIDLLVDLAWSVPGVLGSRMTGGGFGGCTVSLVKTDSVEPFKKIVGQGYKEKTGLDAEFYVVNIGDGAHRIL